MPFEVPKSWEWVKLGEIGTWQSGATPSRLNKNYYGGNIPWLKTGDLNDGYITYIPEYITQKALEETSVKLNPTGSVLIAMYGATIGKVGILTFPSTTNQACCACVDYNAVTAKYLFYFLLSHRDEFIKLGMGGAQPNISKEKITDELIPLPPYDEQQRITKAVEKWSSLIDKIEAEQQDLSALIANAKNKVLDLAIHGKLVPQDPTDEPAEELLRRINPQWQPCDTSHYENLPQGWTIVRLGEIASFERGITFPSTAKSRIKENGMVACLRTANVHEELTLEDLLYIDESYIKGNQAKEVRINDIIISTANSREMVGRACLVKNSPTEKMTFGGFVTTIRLNNCCLPTFFIHYLHHLFHTGLFMKICTQTTNLANIKTSGLSELQICLPPIAEQERIVSKIDEIHFSIDSIRQTLAD